MKRQICLWFTLLIALTVFRAEAFDRIFTTPEERAGIDLRRYQAPEAIGTTDPAQAVTERLTVNGLVTTRRGAASAWMNGDLERPQQRGAMQWQPERLSTTRGVRIRLDSIEGSYTLRPGQSLSLSERRMLDAYQIPPESTALPQQQSSGGKDDSGGDPALMPVPE